MPTLKALMGFRHHGQAIRPGRVFEASVAEAEVLMGTNRAVEVAPSGFCTRDTLRCAVIQDPLHETPACCRGHIVEVVRYVGDLLTRAGIVWWADYGTLLGAVRDGRLIPWDSDADLGVLGEYHGDVLQLAEQIERDGYLLASLRRTGRMFGGGDRAKVYLSARNRTPVDLFFWHRKTNGDYARNEYVPCDQSKGREFPEDRLFPLTTVKWEGLTLPAPADPEWFCEHRYGPNWRAPSRDNAGGRGKVRATDRPPERKAAEPQPKVSFCVHTFDEADAIRRLLTSSLPLVDLFDEWVVVDHRSRDHTPDVLAEMRPVLAEHGITLTTWREARDLSASYSFADIRNDTIKASRNAITVLHDADFILGPGFRAVLERAVPALLDPRQKLHSATFAVPVVWDHIKIDAAGIVTDHGRVWVHPHRPRVLLRDHVHYEQIGNGGRWEKLIFDPRRPDRLNLTQVKAARPHTVISVNAKAPDKIALRDTMTMFMEDAHSGKATGGWLENYSAGLTRSQGEYKFAKVDLRGWRLYAPNLELRTA